MSLLTPYRELLKERERADQAEQARNYYKHQCVCLKRKVEEQDHQLENSAYAFKLADAKRAMAEQENAGLREENARLRKDKERLEAIVAAFEQREREHLEDEHRRTGMIAS